MRSRKPSRVVADPQQEILTEGEAAAFLRVKPRTLSQWRWRGTGPTYSKSGGVRYRRTDLLAFIESCAVTPGVPRRRRRAA